MPSHRSDSNANDGNMLAIAMIKIALPWLFWIQNANDSGEKQITKKGSCRVSKDWKKKNNDDDDDGNDDAIDMEFL